MGERAVIRRRGAMTATPYLRRWISGPKPSDWKLPDLGSFWTGMPRVLDLGCGNGRNSEYLRGLGMYVHSYDMYPDYTMAPHPAWMAGRDDIPEGSRTFDLVLCQYVLMFLSDDEIYRLLLEIERVTKAPSGYVIFELEKVKSGRDMRLSKIIDFFLDDSHLTPRQRRRRSGAPEADWRIFHAAKNRCVLRRTNAPSSEGFEF